MYLVQSYVKFVRGLFTVQLPAVAILRLRKDSTLQAAAVFHII